VLLLVVGETAGLLEGGAAPRNKALVWALARVNVQVVLQVVLKGKLPFADVALVSLCLGMSYHVSLHPELG
jgi:hypothetical protein